MNYTKAAQELNITQPGVSQHIKYLENYYGDKLFTYSNKILTLTQSGEELKNAMLSIKHDNLHLIKKISGQADELKSIKFGATLTIGEFMLPKKLINFIKQNPKTQIEFTIANTQELLSLLENGSIDFAIIEGYFPKSQYEFITVSNENYIAVCSNNYPLKSVYNFQELFSHNLLVREDGSGTKEILERYLSENGYSLNNFQNISVISNIQVIKQLLENNCGITFIYEIAVKKELSEGTLRQINISNFDLYHEFNYIWRKNSVFSDYYNKICNSLLM
jgi:DNA-binding transcriptional LysR family regulator